MWYFGENDQQHGPVSLDELKAMIRSGRLTVDTLVWRQGMSDWMPVQGVPELRLEADLARRGEVGPRHRPIHVTPPAGSPSSGTPSSAQPFPSGGAPASPASPAAPAIDSPEDAALRPLRPLPSAPGMGYCVKCGVALPTEGVGHEPGSGQGLCSNCRAAVAASLGQAQAGLGGGAEAPAAGMAMARAPVAYYQYGGFLLRFAAVFCDSFIVWLVSVAVGMAISFGVDLVSTGLGGETQTLLELMVMSANAFFGVLLPTLYHGYFLSTQGATPGKKLLGLGVIRPDGTYVSFVRGMCRYWATGLSGLLCGIGYFMALFDDEKRALHDHICDTRVVSTR
ncbi:MAG: RDD family protein [Lentisphaerae bacterium ADurb.Bin082]|nr:MAG: RDD family protein [Lentisphaerae bacterium ADurb.Bin082]